MLDKQTIDECKYYIKQEYLFTGIREPASYYII